MASIRNPIIRYSVLVLVSLMHAIRPSLQFRFWNGYDGAQYLSKALFNPRLYVFSKKATLVPWQGVHKHANDAITLGLNVRCEVYGESAHVAHMRLDLKRYWASVQELWEIAYSENQVHTKQSA